MYQVKDYETGRCGGVFRSFDDALSEAIRRMAHDESVRGVAWQVVNTTTGRVLWNAK